MSATIGTAVETEAEVSVSTVAWFAVAEARYVARHILLVFDNSLEWPFVVTSLLMSATIGTAVETEAEVSVSTVAWFAETEAR